MEPAKNSIRSITGTATTGPRASPVARRSPIACRNSSPLRPRSMCLFCEGEKDADNLAKIGVRGNDGFRGRRGQMGSWTDAVLQGSARRDIAGCRSTRSRACAKGCQSDPKRRRFCANSRSVSRQARRIRCLGLHHKRYRRRQVGERGEGGAAVGAKRNRDKRRRGGRWRRTTLGCVRVSRALRCLSFRSRACRTYAMDRARAFDGGLGQHAAHRVPQPRAGIRQDTRVRGLRDSWCRIRWRR